MNTNAPVSSAKLSNNIFSKFKETVARFYLTYVCLLIFTLLTIIEPFIRYWHEDRFKLLFQNLYMCLTIGVYWFISAKLFAENRKRSNLTLSLLGILFIIFVGHAFTSLDIETTCILGLMSTIPFLTVAPFMFKKVENKDFWAFALKVNIILFFSLALWLLVWAIFTAILFITILFIESSFDLPSAIYGTKSPSLFIISYNVFLLGYPITAIYFLCNLPKSIKFDDYKKKTVLVIRFLLTYLIPLVLTYISILYANIIKTVIQLKTFPHELLFSPPQDRVEYLIPMIVCAGTIGIIIHLLSYPFKNDNKILRFFYQHFYKLFIPIVLCLLAILGFRIYLYGLTGFQCFATLIAIWFISLSIINVFSKQNFSIKLVPFFLSILLMFCSFNLDGINKLSFYSQKTALKKMLTKNHVLVNEKMTSTHSRISKKEEARIKFIIWKITANDRGLNYIKSWLSEDQIKQLEKEQYPYYINQVIFNIMGLS